jgi:hypothetical protein
LRKRYRAIYLMAVLLAGFGSIPAAFVFESELLTFVMGNLLLSVLSYPFGVLATAFGYGLMLLGLVTPMEAVVLMTPLAALLGYLQWFRIIPAFYNKAS